METIIDPRSPKNRSISLSTLILLALGAGILFGIGLNQFAPTIVPGLDHYVLDPIGQIFLRLIQFVVIPIVFSSLILGLTRIQDASQVGRYTLKLMTSYAITSAIAVALGMVTCSILQPGSGITGLSLPAATIQAESLSLLDWLISLVPVNPVEALSTGNLLQTIFSAALIGVGIQIAGEKATSFLAVV
ncbi:MAG: cation:dicarboxylase symporter family transporter, partial [Leptolyngbyaceae cyanobacterium CAN_BIN12]|nr:cation:dicarboxylase symporter family transporter [Leptolyngbyaceae cyanobacterium CAN_BIN12]